MINQYTHFTFIDLNLYQSPIDELVKVTRSRRNRVISVVQIEPPTEDRSFIYCMILKSSIADSNSAVVYHISVQAAGNMQNQILELFRRNQIKIIESKPDLPQKDKDKDRLIRKADSVVDKNPQHEYLEKKIKEIA